MRADRLMELLLILQKGGKWTARELARELEVSQRTVLRDLDALGRMGIPVVADRGRHGGWYLLDSFRKTLLTLNQDEVASLFFNMPEKLLKDLGLERTYRMARRKLSSALPDRTESQVLRWWERIHLDTEPWKGGNSENEWMEPILRAVLEERKLWLGYERLDGKQSERIVEPLGLVAKGAVWYLVANTAEGIKSFKLNRIQSARMLAETFDRPEGFDLAEWWNASKARFVARLPEYIVRVRLTPHALRRIRFSDRFVRVLSVEDPDEMGWIAATLRFDTRQEAAEWSLGMHREVLVVEPEDLRETVRELAKAVVNMYGDDSGDI
ncbi:helix-turn-helix transcriptional regulator [Staphylospora marina]|uniref:helix-turn-helix transcriptional regulator n=1 Tax=Staphylospora marina TaxID=2490858 RepID=UPI0013DDED49|nr:YafY family protein [Staphylospora marina]